MLALRTVTYCTENEETPIGGARTKQPYPEEFKIDAAKQITERGHRVADVSTRIGVSQHSLYKWIKAYAVPVYRLPCWPRSATHKRSCLPIKKKGWCP